MLAFGVPALVCCHAPEPHAVDADGDGWSEADGDCNDDDAGVNPGETDMPRNGIDDNCDGSDAGVRSLAEASVRIDGTAPNGLAGSAVATGGDLDGDGFGDLVIGAPGGWADNAPFGHVYVFSGPVSSTDMSRAEGWVDGEAQFDGSGYAVAMVGDVDADGFDDLAIGAPMNFEGAAKGGAVFLFHGPILGERGTGSADATFWGTTYGAAAGTSVAGIGDVDGDGLDDVAIGSPNIFDDPAPGQVNVWFGPQAGTGGEVDVVLTSDQEGDRAGERVASAGDANGDGWVDLLVGAPLSGENNTRIGKVWLAYGPLLEGGFLRDFATALIGEELNDYAGNAVSSAGDVDGNGTDDILCGGHLGSEGGERSGKAWLVLEPGTGTYALEEADGRFVGEMEHNLAGWAVGSGLEGGMFAVAAPGDPYAWGSNPGLVYLWGQLPLDPTAALVLQGEAAGDEAGYALASGGDVSGDGRPDLVVGAPGVAHLVEGGGAVYVVAADGSLLDP